jgi:hypothetical protein
MVISTGATLAIIALTIGLTVNKPSIDKMAAIGKAAAESGTPPTPEQQQLLQKLRGKLFWGINVMAYLVFGAAIAMSIARYF